MTVEAPRAVVCGECGGLFELSARSARARRTRGQEPVCRPCRHTPKPPTEAQLERYRRWWLDRYSIDELLELGREIGWC
jgi:hypothetical protein